MHYKSSCGQHRGHSLAGWVTGPRRKCWKEGTSRHPHPPPLCDFAQALPLPIPLQRGTDQVSVMQHYGVRVKLSKDVGVPASESRGEVTMILSHEASPRVSNICSQQVCKTS